jgi:hypothetical protein
MIYRRIAVTETDSGIGATNSKLVILNSQMVSDIEKAKIEIQDGRYE